MPRGAWRRRSRAPGPGLLALLAAAFAVPGFAALVALGCLALTGFAVLALGALDGQERALLRRPRALLRPHRIAAGGAP